MSFSNKKPDVFDYVFENVNLEHTKAFMDLGVTINDTLTWDSHINTCVKKANRRLGLVKRCIGHTCSSGIKKYVILHW